jgi:beta-lactamase class A
MPNVKVLSFALLLCASATVVAQPTPVDKATQLRTRVSVELERIADSVDGIVGYAIVDLTTGDRFERQADRPFPTASTIKLAILYELLHQVDEKKLTLDDPQPIDPRLRVGGSGVLAQLSAPVLSLRDCAILMMMASDNTATNVVIDAVGMEAVNTRSRSSIGTRSLALRRRMMDSAAARRGDENVASPADLERVLQVLHRGVGLSETARATALDMMTRPMDSPLRAGIPAGVRVASKPGSLDGVEADAGIVHLEGRPFVIVVMTTFLAQNGAGGRAITDITRTTFGYFNRLARAGVEGRLLDRQPIGRLSTPTHGRRAEIGDNRCLSQAGSRSGVPGY